MKPSQETYCEGKTDFLGGRKRRSRQKEQGRVPSMISALLRRILILHLLHRCGADRENTGQGQPGSDAFMTESESAGAFCNQGGTSPFLFYKLDAAHPYRTCSFVVKNPQFLA